MVALHVPVADEEVGLVAGAVGVLFFGDEAEAARARSLAQRAVLLAVPEAYHAAAQFQLQLLQILVHLDDVLAVIQCLAPLQLPPGGEGSVSVCFLDTFSFYFFYSSL